MSEEAKVNTETNEVQKETIDELALLKQRADLVGLKYHHRVGAEKLKIALKEFMTSQNAQEVIEQQEAAPAVIPVVNEYQPETAHQKRQRAHREAARLIRVRITNMNPNKKDWEGEIYTVSNAVVGTFKKYVPFNSDEGWHVPQIILNVMKEKECQVFYTEKTANGRTKRTGKLIKELAIEVLDPLTITELKKLAQQQAMVAGNEFHI